MDHPPATPHGKLEQVFDGIYVVRGQISMKMGIRFTFSRAMTVVRGNQGLVIFNSMRLSDEGLADLESLGEVKHVVRLAGFHGRDDGFYRDRYGANVMTIAGQKYIRSMDGKKGSVYMEPDQVLNDGSALPILDARIVVLPGCHPPEGLCLIERDGGILIAGDSLQNMAGPDEYTGSVSGLIMRAMGFYRPSNVGPGWVKMAKASAETIDALRSLEFENLVPAHGLPVLGGARKQFEASLEKARARVGA